MRIFIILLLLFILIGTASAATLYKGTYYNCSIEGFTVIGGSALLSESNDFILSETGNYILLE